MRLSLTFLRMSRIELAASEAENMDISRLSIFSGLASL